MYSLLRALLFSFEPETSHQLTLRLLQIGGYEPIASVLRTIYSAPQKPVDVFGLRFKNPIGLAAGYDKNGIALAGLATLGLGHVEVGTITPLAQSGNPRPRVFRLVEDNAVINRMGFPSEGMEKVASRMSKVKGQAWGVERGVLVVGANLGKNKDTPLEEAASDYLKLMRVFAPLADYLTINISSPNTVGLRRLQGREMLEGLLGEISKESQKSQVKRPVLVKISPDLSDEELDDAVGVILDKGMDGIIATNTTLGREGLVSKFAGEAGGLSGDPLRGKSDAVLHQVIKRVNGKIPVVGVGGIFNPDSAKQKLAAGASLVQIYTGLIYKGPKLISEILRAL